MSPSTPPLQSDASEESADADALLRARCPRCNRYLFAYRDALTVTLVHRCDRCDLYIWLQARRGLLLAVATEEVRYDARRRRLPPKDDPGDLMDGPIVIA